MRNMKFCLSGDLYNLYQKMKMKNSLGLEFMASHEA